MAALRPYRETATGLTLALRVTPNARRAAIDGLRDGPDGPVLAVAVTAPPEDGKANAALAALLAETLDLAKSAVTVARGAKSRYKTVALAGDPRALAAKIDTLLSGVSPHDRRDG